MSVDYSRTSLRAYFTDLAIAECLASMRVKQAAKRHGDASLERWLKIDKKKVEDGESKKKAAYNDPGTYLPPRRLWSRISLKERMKVNKTRQNKLGMMRHVRWAISNGKLRELEWGRRFMEFAARVRARIEARGISFALPASFAIKKLGKDDRFVTSFMGLEDKVILRQTAKYLRRVLDSRLSPDCYSFRNDATIDHTTAVEALMEYRAKHAGETLCVVECDIRKFFDVIDHDVAMRAFRRIAKGMHVNPLAKRIFKAYLAAYTSTETLISQAKEASRGKCSEYLGRINLALEDVGGAEGRRVGVPQGGPLSMLIANWVLDYADRHVKRNGDDGLFYARFCDDIVIVHPDKRVCRAARDRYLRAMRRLLLPYHKVKNRIPYGKGFYETKSKGPYEWRALSNRMERGASPWVSFLGNQVRYDGEVRVRQSSIDRHVRALKEVRRKMLGLIYASECPGSGVALRKGKDSLPGAAAAMIRSIVSRGVGYLRAGPFSAGRISDANADERLRQASGMFWMSAFPDIRGTEAEHQLRQLDAVRADILHPIFKKARVDSYAGRPASYFGFLDEVARPAVGKGRKAPVMRIGYSEM